MVHPAQTRIMQNGSGWYWEVVTYNQEVVIAKPYKVHRHAIIEPVIPISAGVPRGNSRLISEAMKIAAIGRAVTK